MCAARYGITLCVSVRIGLRLVSVRLMLAHKASEYIIPASEPYPNYARQAKALTEARQGTPRLKDVNAQVLQQILRRLETAFEDMNRKGLGFPRFKKFGRMRSFVFPQFKSNPLSGNQIKLPALGWIKMILSRPIPEGFELKQVRILRKASGYFAMLSRRV